MGRESQSRELDTWPQQSKLILSLMLALSNMLNYGLWYDDTDMMEMEMMGAAFNEPGVAHRPEKQLKNGTLVDLKLKNSQTWPHSSPGLGYCY